MENSEVNKRTMIKTDTYGYENTTYHPSSTVTTQPLPGQPPLPPMPPPPGALPPLPMFSTMPQVAWPPTNPWQWITASQATGLSAQPARDIAANNILKSSRGNYIRRDRFNNHNRNVYPQRGNYHRNKNRRRFENQQQQQQSIPSQFDPTSAGYWQNSDWPRANLSAAQTADHIATLSTQLNTGSNVSTSVEKTGEAGDQDVKIVSEIAVKKTKQRKPMSQSYPIRNWNLEDAKTALKVENEYNKSVRAQSLIIKFPDPDLNKDIVREFHAGIQNIHFQSPSGPRYCFVQMAEDVDIDKAIMELEKIPFGIGHLKVERKSLRDEDYPQPEEIDPYTLYVGNLPESVNVNEVKSKFPTATRVDVGYAQKMRNTRYAFIRYANVEDSIAAYKQAHDLMWDTRSIIVRFRRQRGNTCLPGETKNNNAKKVKDEPEDTRVKNPRINIHNGTQPKDSANKESNKTEADKENSTTMEDPLVAPTIISHQQHQPWTLKSPQQASAAEPVLNKDQNDTDDGVLMSVTIKEEPEDYEEMDIPYTPIADDDDTDDENDEPDDLDYINNEIDDNDDNEPADDNDDDSENLINFGLKDNKLNDTNVETSDHLDHMFSALTNCGDIEL